MFKVGDIVKGTSLSQSYYGITNNLYNRKFIVTGIEGRYIRISLIGSDLPGDVSRHAGSYDVLPECFVKATQLKLIRKERIA